jgi:hypothetical protein
MERGRASQRRLIFTQNLRTAGGKSNIIRPGPTRLHSLPLNFNLPSPHCVGPASCKPLRCQGLFACAGNWSDFLAQGIDSICNFQSQGSFYTRKRVIHIRVDCGCVRKRAGQIIRSGLSLTQERGHQRPQSK